MRSAKFGQDLKSKEIILYEYFECKKMCWKIYIVMDGFIKAVLETKLL